MPQTSILSAPVAGYAGQKGDAAFTYIRSGIAEGVVVPGQPVLRGTDPDNQVAPLANGSTVDATTIAGFVCLDTALEGAPADEDVVQVMRVGTIWVSTSAAVTAGNPVYVGNATAQLGDIDDATGVGLALLPGARFLTSTTAAGLALVQVNMI